jgi:hypothetical protein
MTARRPSRLALAIFDGFAGGSEPLKGDLVEEFEARRSQWWLWRQVIGAVLCRRKLPAIRRPINADMLFLGAAILVLISFEAVFVINLLHRLLFGPPLPDISGYFYLWQNGAGGSPPALATRVPLESPYAPLIAAAASTVIGWLIRRFHQHHHTLSVAAFTLSVVLCVMLNLQLAFGHQFLTTLVFILGLLAGGRFGGDEWTSRTA